MIPLLFLILILAIILKSVLRRVREDQRGLLFIKTHQFSKKEFFLDVVDPGWRFVVPHVHRIEIIPLEDISPNFAEISNQGLKDSLVLNKLGQDVLDEWIKNGRQCGAIELKT